MKPAERLLYTPDGACEALGIRPTKFWELIRIGALRSVKIGSARRVPAEALHEFVARLEAEAGTLANG